MTENKPEIVDAEEITDAEIERHEAIADALDKQDENLAMIRRKATAVDAAYGKSLQKAVSGVKTITTDAIEKTISYGKYGVAMAAIERIIENPELLKQLSLELLATGETIDEYIARMCALIIRNREREERIAELKAKGENIGHEYIKNKNKTSKPAIMKALNIEKLEKKLKITMEKLKRLDDLRTCGMSVLLERQAKQLFNRNVDEIKAQRLIEIAGSSNDGGTAMSALRMIDEQRRRYPHVPPKDNKDDSIVLQFTNYYGDDKEKHEIKITRNKEEE